MNSKIREDKFLQALEICQSLNEFKCQPSSLPCDAIKLLCEAGKSPDQLLALANQYREKVAQADLALEAYARSIDNWKFGDCPLGVKDQCNILHFFLNVYTQKFTFFRGQDLTPELICEFLQEWQGIDLTSLISEKPSQLITQ
jgi:hypothetical protein